MRKPCFRFRFLATMPFMPIRKAQDLLEQESQSVSMAFAFQRNGAAGVIPRYSGGKVLAKITIFLPKRDASSIFARLL